jgi:transcriptional regulator with XRE-family HTH domain
MRVNLTLQEKLRDLRDERKLRLQDIADATGIPLATLGRIENNEDNQASFQNIAILARFYNVSTDYLFGVTDNLQHRNVEIDALSLSDNAIAMLKSKKLNNRLVSELLSHADFQQLINAIEVYIDKKMLPQMNTMNAVYRLAETTIEESSNMDDSRNEILAFLQNAVVKEDEYLRFRISERFNAILISLFDAHRQDTLPPEHNEVMEDMKGLLQGYMNDRKTQPEAKAKFLSLCKQLGLNANKLDEDEMRVMMKVLERSPLVKRGGRK